MMLTKLTPEGRIILTLEHGCHTYGELRRETRLSDRWLIRKLSELKRRAVIKKTGRWYGLAKEFPVSPYERALYRRTELSQAVNYLTEKCPQILAIVLYGSTAKATCTLTSDVDLLIVVEKTKRIHEVRERIEEAANDLFFMFHINFEPLVLTADDFLANLASKEGGIIYGIANGYEMLYDRVGDKLTNRLSERISQIKCGHECLEEHGIWLKK